ncbi:ATP-binding protein [Bacillus salipaludis]|uniref:ATP-binding protein n=1 Tax=Bacillus salipaludis TaxID=2547811 RepID=UPI002E203A37|nr:ATP-binding protein [Bacillus salipaludis]
MNTDLLTERLKSLGFHLTSNLIEGILEDASKDNVSYSDFLNTVLLQEIENKERINLDRRLKKSKLPFYKKIEDFDFDFQSSISERRIKEAMTCPFHPKWREYITLGPARGWKDSLSYWFNNRSDRTRKYSLLYKMR